MQLIYFEHFNYVIDLTSFCSIETFVVFFKEVLRKTITHRLPGIKKPNKTVKRCFYILMSFKMEIIITHVEEICIITAATLYSAKV